MKNKTRLSIILFVIVLINYILTRVVFFDVHGMIDFTNSMSLLSAALTCIYVLSDNNVASICSSVGNLISFFIGYLFNKTIDYINNYWLIWGISYILIVVIGYFIGKRFHVKHGK